MNDPIISRAHRANLARMAAELASCQTEFGETVTVANPYPEGSDAAKHWDAAFKRYSAEIEGCEASA